MSKIIRMCVVWPGESGNTHALALQQGKVAVFRQPVPCLPIIRSVAEWMERQTLCCVSVKFAIQNLGFRDDHFGGPDDDLPKAFGILATH